MSKKLGLTALEEDGHAPSGGSERIRSQTHMVTSHMAFTSRHQISQWLVSAGQPAVIFSHHSSLLLCPLTVHCDHFPSERSSFTVKSTPSPCNILMLFSHGSQNKLTSPALSIASLWVCHTVCKTAELSMKYWQLELNHIKHRDPISQREFRAVEVWSPQAASTSQLQVCLSSRVCVFHIE